MPDNFNTIEGTEVLNLNDGVQGSHAVTVGDIKEYTNIGVPGELVFEAYITQKNGDNPIGQTSGSLIIGVTYVINSHNIGDDFTNVGASSNADGVRFIATGTTPAVWTNSSDLGYNEGAPIILYIIKNTLNCSGFSYQSTGKYNLYFPTNLIDEKTFVQLSIVKYEGNDSITSNWYFADTERIMLYTSRNGSGQDSLLHSYIKVVVIP